MKTLTTEQMQAASGTFFGAFFILFDMIFNSKSSYFTTYFTNTTASQTDISSENGQTGILIHSDGVITSITHGTNNTINNHFK